MLMLLTVCLVAEPARCREERIQLSYGGGSPIGCLRHSQSTLADWQATHPEWHVARWRCAVRGTEPKDL